jgi:hypothetical protein
MWVSRASTEPFVNPKVDGWDRNATISQSAGILTFINRVHFHDPTIRASLKTPPGLSNDPPGDPIAFYHSL